jgi:hypothetical protein
LKGIKRRVKKMKDKSLEISLIAVFGISGMAIILLGWLWPALESDRIMATLVGLTGMLIAFFRYMGLKKYFRTEAKRVAVEVEVAEKH